VKKGDRQDGAATKKRRVPFLQIGRAGPRESLVFADGSDLWAGGTVVPMTRRLESSIVSIKGHVQFGGGKKGGRCVVGGIIAEY